MRPGTSRCCSRPWRSGSDIRTSPRRSTSLPAGIAEGQTVLLTAVGAGAGFASVVALRRHFASGIRIIAADTNPSELVTASLLSDRFFRIPGWRAPAFPARLQEIVRAEAVTTYVPLLDGEIALAAELASTGWLKRTTIVAPGGDVARRCLDKWQCAQWLVDHGVPTPRTWLGTDDLPSGDYFLKPRSGNGSHGVRRVSSRDLQELETEARAESIVQELCAGPEVTVDVFFAPDLDFLRAVARERLE